MNRESPVETAESSPPATEEPFALRDIHLRIRHGWFTNSLVTLKCLSFR